MAGVSGVVIVLLLTGAFALPGATARGLSVRTTLVSGPSPFTPGCAPDWYGEPNYQNAEVEPRVAVDPEDQDHIVGVWQQDRWAFGGAHGLLAGASFDGGRTWTRSMAAFDRCAGGNAANGGDYERSSDPWVTISPNGRVYQIAIAFDFFTPNNAVVVSQSSDGGLTWGNPVTLIRDTEFQFFNDKESITADPGNARFVYAVWDRSTGLGGGHYTGPVYFSRTTDRGTTWEPARAILETGVDESTVSNQIVVLSNGDLVDMFAFFPSDWPNAPPEVDVILSQDHGATWSGRIKVADLRAVGVYDPDTGRPLRTGDVIPDIAVDRESRTVYVVWQDGRFSSFDHDDIALSASHDGGKTWSQPSKINKSPVGIAAFTASVSVASDGTVGVTYYDLRGNTPDPNTLPTDYWFVRCKISCNDGARWSSETHIRGPFDMQMAPFAGGFFVGDYEGLAALGQGFLAFFVATNSGDFNNPTDVFAARIAGGQGQNRDG